MNTTGTIESLQSRCFSEIEAKPVQWLWPNRIPSKITILAGEPGKGKSQLTVKIAATVTVGGSWPDGTQCKEGSVVFITCEDDPADTIKPRLIAAGADTKRVHIVEGLRNSEGKTRTWTLEDSVHLKDLCAKIKNVKLIVIDPITAYIGSKDGHNAADIRGLLAPLMALADQYGIAVVAVSHLNKSMGNTPMSRVTGSGAYVAASRVSLLVADHPDIEDAQVIATLKTNLSPDKTGFGYKIVGRTIDGGIQTSCIEWIPGSIDVDPNALLSPVSKSEPDLDTETAKGNAVAFLIEALTDGPQLSAKVFELADKHGIAKATLNRAKKDMRVKSVKEGGRWYMALPAGDNQGYQEGGPENVDNLDNVDYLEGDLPCFDRQDYQGYQDTHVIKGADIDNLEFGELFEEVGP